MAEPQFTRRESFPKTRWTLVQRAGEADPEQKRQALEEFCRTYWLPLYSYARRRGKAVHDAQDLIKGFFAKLLNDPDFFEKPDAERGKLRSWLLTALQFYDQDEWDKTQAQKRGGGTEILAIDTEIAEERLGEVHELNAEEAARDFDRRWAETVLTSARRNLKISRQAVGKADEYDALKPFLTEGTSAELTQKVATRLGKSTDAGSMAISRLRESYRQEIRKVISETVGIDADVEQEIGYLISCLSR